MKFRGDQARLFTAARAARISQVRIADYLGLTPQTLHRYSSMQRELPEHAFLLLNDLLFEVTGRLPDDSIIERIEKIEKKICG
jgi:hypothetical protein